jgi:hypothetical protein
MNSNPVWDPMLVHDGRRWFMYVLTTPKQAQQTNFFTENNFVLGFVSTDLGSWKEIGTVLPSGFFGKRLCGGSLFYEEGTYYFFGSATIEQLSADQLDQRLFLATSKDGLRFNFEESFSLEPEQNMYGTNVRHPQTGHMLFAWRDPYIFRDPISGKYHLFICAGGKRWGVPPKIAAAVSNNIRGPYKLQPPAAISYGEIEAGIMGVPVWEMERVQVSYYKGRYRMLFSVWGWLIDEKWKAKLEPKCGPIGRSLAIMLSSDKACGPYSFDGNVELVRSKNQDDMYGLMLVDTADLSDEPVVAGWFLNSFRSQLVPFDSYEVIKITEKIQEY